MKTPKWKKGAERKIHKAAGTRGKHEKGVYVPRYVVKVQKFHPTWGVYDGDVLVEGGFYKSTAIDMAKQLNEAYERALEDYASTLNK